MKTKMEEIQMPKPKRTRYLKKKPKATFYSKMDKIVRNQGLQHISKSIFKCLDIKTLLTCREVSKNWKMSWMILGFGSKCVFNIKCLKSIKLNGNS